MVQSQSKTLVVSDAKTKVFISYSRRNMDWADWLVEQLSNQGIEVLIDRHDIVPGEAWEPRIYSLIDQADTVIFLISSASVNSGICHQEVEYSESLNKRFVPLLLEDPINEKGEKVPVPEALQKINYIFFNKGSDPHKSLKDLVQALLVDIHWVREHTRIGELAQRWDRAGQPSSQLLRGKDLEAAEQWRDHPQKDTRPPTELQLRYIAACRKGAGKRRNMLVGSLVAGLVIAVGLGGLAFWQREEAVNNKKIATLRSLKLSEQVASQNLREGDFASAATNLRDVINSKDPSLTKQVIFNAITANLKSVKDVLNGIEKWSVFSWKNRLFIRGEQSSDIYEVSAMASPYWKKHLNMIVIYNSFGNIISFDIKTKKVVEEENIKGSTELTGTSFDEKGIYICYAGFRGAKDDYWKIELNGKITNNVYTESKPYCDDIKSFKSHEKYPSTLKIFTPHTINENHLWSKTARKNSSLDKARVALYFQSTKDNSMLHNGIQKNIRYYEEYPGEIFWTGKPEFSLRLPKAQILFGYESSAMSGDPYNFCSKITLTKELICNYFFAEFYRKNKGKLNGITISENGNIAFVYGTQIGYKYIDNTVKSENFENERSSLSDFHFSDEGIRGYADIYFSKGPRFDHWVPIKEFATIGEISDVEISPSGKKIAIVSATGIYIYSIGERFDLIKRLKISNDIKVGWISNNTFVLLSDKGVLRALSLETKQLWSEIDFSYLPFKKAENSHDEIGFLISTDAEKGLILITNGQSSIVLDAKLGAPITGVFKIDLLFNKFNRPKINLEKDGQIRIDHWVRKGAANNVNIDKILEEKTSTDIMSLLRD